MNCFCFSLNFNVPLKLSINFAALSAISLTLNESSTFYVLMKSVLDFKDFGSFFKNSLSMVHQENSFKLLSDIDHLHYNLNLQK